MNAITIIHPRWIYGTWCFSDSDTGLVNEPFVAGIPEIIDALILKAGLNLEECKQNGCKITFSGTEFPGYTGKLDKLEQEVAAGTWYTATIDEKEYVGWLCPALFKYFEAAPQEIYAKIENI